MIGNIENKIETEIKNTYKKAGLSLKRVDLKVNLNRKYQLRPKFGDYCATIIYKGQSLDPDILRRMKSEIEKSGFSKKYIKEIKLDGPNPNNPIFMNFFIKPELAQERLKEIIEDENFGKPNIGKNKEIIIDYSSPNIAKPMHVGHLRSTVIGQALYNIYKNLGYKVKGDNHIGDWGTQFGIMIAACKKYKTDLKNITIEKMLDIYVRFNKEIEVNPELQETAKEEFKKLEDNDKENKKIWKILKDKSLIEFDKLYKTLGVKFDLIHGESFYEKFLKEEIEMALKKKKAIRNSDGSVIINLEKFNLIPYLIQKSDGATLYSTRDLATIRHRIKEYKPEKILYVVGNEQSLHFEQLFHSAELLNYIPYEKLEHVKFGLVLDENKKKLATRKGKFISAEDLINKIINSAEQVIKEKNSKLSEKERKECAKIIGIGALKYNDLSQNRKTDIVFDWEKMLNFEGNSAPYIQYSYVRLKSILKKTKLNTKFNPEYLKEDLEIFIICFIDAFEKNLIMVTKKNQNNYLAQYLFDLADLMNKFYEKFSVLNAKEKIKSARLNLINLVANKVLKHGLNLLGIDVPKKM